MTEASSNLPLFPMKRDSRCPFDPPPELKRLQAEAPVSKVRIWNGNTAWLVTRYDDVRFVLKDARFSVDNKRPGYPPMSAGHATRRTGLWPDIFAMDNPLHNDFRKIQNADFRIDRVEARRPQVQTIVDQAIDELLAKSPPVDLVETFALPVPSLVICEMLGIPYSAHDFFQHQSRILIDTTSTKEQSEAALAELKGYMADLVAAKMAEPTDDFISRMAVEQVSKNQLTPADVANMAVNLLSAGHNTTSTTIALSVALLLQHPDKVDEIRNGDAKFIARATEELLRYLAITHLGRRRVALEDVEVGGQLIKAGDGVIAGNMIGDRDDRAFASPDTLDFHRDARHHLAFGFGTHQCLGQPLVRVELQVVLSTLFRRIPTLQLAIPADKLDFNYDGLIWGLNELPVTW